MKNLLLVDGHNLLFQMFFGMPSRIVNKQGKAIQGTLGFVGALNKIAAMVKPTHLAVLFDGEHENSRAQLLPGYKANRPGFSEVAKEDNPFSQLPDVYRALDFMGVRHAEIQEGEADDAIAAYAFAYGVKRRARVTIASQDSDFFQLINENISVLRYGGKKTVVCGEDYVQERFGILPAQYACFKSLTGDAADNIRGLAGVGPKTAAALLKRFGSLHGLIAEAHTLEKPSLRDAVTNNAKRLALNYGAIKLSETGEMPFAAEKAPCPVFLPTMQVLAGIGLK